MRAQLSPLKSRRAMLDTLLKHLDMVRLSVGALAIVMLSACNGLITAPGGGGDDGLTPEQRMAQQLWLTGALPVFKEAAPTGGECASCHDGGPAAPAAALPFSFLAGDSDIAIHDTIVAFTPAVVDLDAPASSRVVVKGAHEGPAMTTDQQTPVLAWLMAEQAAAAAGTSTTVLLPKFTPAICPSGTDASACPVNTMTLDAVMGPGATVTFIAYALNDTLYVMNLSINGGPNGVYVEHPLFVSYPADPTADPIPDNLDRFFAIKDDQAATTSTMLGTAAFVGFDPTLQISIQFKTVGAYQAGMGGTMPPSGCHQLADFKTDAQGPMTTNCQTCHSGKGATKNAQAMSSMDITGIEATDDPTILTACNQVRTQINFQQVAMSGFFISPNPSDADGHPFKFGNNQGNFNAFQTALMPWVTAEATSP